MVLIKIRSGTIIVSIDYRESNKYFALFFINGESLLAGIIFSRLWLISSDEYSKPRIRILATNVHNVDLKFHI